MNSISPSWVIDQSIKVFKPRDSSLPEEHLEKHMAASFNFILSLACSTPNHLIFFMFISRYQVGLLTFYLLFHCIALLSILLDPVKLIYFLPCAFVYLFTLGPTLLEVL